MKPRKNQSKKNNTTINSDLIVEELRNLSNEMRTLNEKVRSIENNVIEKNIQPENEIETWENDKDKKTKKYLWIGEVAFYIVLILIVAGAFLIKSAGNGKPISIAGVSMFTVLTGSMEREIPKGSLVIVKNVPASELKIGDDITYLANETTTITHRIIAITEQYLNTGKRAFETQGVMNEKPDKNLVPEANVIGKVVFHSKEIGDITNFISKNWPFILFVLATIYVFLSYVKKSLNEDETKTTTENNKQTDKKKISFKERMQMRKKKETENEKK